MTAIDVRTDVALLEVDGLRVSFKARTNRLGPSPRVRAVNDVSFSVAPGESVGLVGESGSGKSTIARAVLRLIPIDAGTIRLDGTDVSGLSGTALRSLRRDAQMVFQDPYSSLDPSMVVADIIGEPLKVHDGARSRSQRHQRVGELLDQVGLSRRHLQRYPYEFSGGQRQRIAIARAIATNPKLVVCDEAVSALDVSTQNQIINLLEDLQQELGIAYLFISHGLAVVRHISQRVVVLYLGKVMESGPVERIFGAPSHPYTQALLSAVPVTDPDVQRSRRRIVLAGDPPDPTALPAGCPFASRCPEVLEVCRSTMPALTAVEGGGEVACHLRAP